MYGLRPYIKAQANILATMATNKFDGMNAGRHVYN